MSGQMHSRAITRRGPVQRPVEIGLGLLLGVATLVPLGAVIAAIGKLVVDPQFSDSSPLWLVALVTLVSSALTWWGAMTTWQLFTGHERPGGGLLSPLVLSIAGVVSIGLAVTMLVWFGLPGVMRAVQFALGGLGLLGLARVRLRKKASRRAA